MPRPRSCAGAVLPAPWAHAPRQAAAVPRKTNGSLHTFQTAFGPQLDTDERRQSKQLSTAPTADLYRSSTKGTEEARTMPCKSAPLEWQHRPFAFHFPRPSDLASPHPHNARKQPQRPDPTASQAAASLQQQQMPTVARCWPSRRYGQVRSHLGSSVSICGPNSHSTR